jgi:hypothetical protein
VIVIVLCYCLYAALLLLCCTLIVLLMLLFVLSLLLFVLSYVLIVCTVSLPPGVNPIAVDKYINQSITRLQGVKSEDNFFSPKFFDTEVR